jgi:hypothetical protein
MSRALKQRRPSTLSSTVSDAMTGLIGANSSEAVNEDVNLLLESTDMGTAAAEASPPGAGPTRQTLDEIYNSAKQVRTRYKLR